MFDFGFGGFGLFRFLFRSFRLFRWFRSGCSGGFVPVVSGFSTCRRLCGKLNHFAVACCSSPQKQQHRRHESDKRQTVKYVDEEIASDITSEHSESDEYMFMVQDTDENTKHPMVNLRIQDLAKVKFIIDTGATVNLLEEKDFEALKPEVKLQHSSINIFIPTSPISPSVSLESLLVL